MNPAHYKNTKKSAAQYILYKFYASFKELVRMGYDQSIMIAHTRGGIKMSNSLPGRVLMGKIPFKDIEYKGEPFLTSMNDLINNEEEASCIFGDPSLEGQAQALYEII